jgi:hypothetical protein
MRKQNHMSAFFIGKPSLCKSSYLDNDERIRLPKLSLPNKRAFAAVSAVQFTQYVHRKVRAPLFYRAGADATDAPVY